MTHVFPVLRENHVSTNRYHDSGLAVGPATPNQLYPPLIDVEIRTPEGYSAASLTAADAERLGLLLIKAAALLTEQARHNFTFDVEIR
jgi:hypothetical protein